MLWHITKCATNNIINVGVGSASKAQQQRSCIYSNGPSRVRVCYSITQMDEWKLIPSERILQEWLLL